MMSDCDGATTKQLGMCYKISKIGFLLLVSYCVDDLGVIIWRTANRNKAVIFLSVCFFKDIVRFILHLHPGGRAHLISIIPNMHQENLQYSQCFKSNVKLIHSVWADVVAQQFSKLNTQIFAIWKVAYMFQGNIHSRVTSQKSTKK